MPNQAVLLHECGCSQGKSCVSQSQFTIFTAKSICKLKNGCMSHNKISMHFILLKCGLSVHCMQISSLFLTLFRYLDEWCFLKKGKTLGSVTSSPLRGQAGMWTLMGD